MYRGCHSNWLIVSISIAVLITFGCASTTPHWQKTAYGTWRYSQEEVDKLPRISIHNIISSLDNSEVQSIQIFVRVRNSNETTRVTRLEDQDYIYVIDANGNEMKINISQIIEIQTIRQIKIAPRQKTTGEVVNEIGEGALYAPLIPIAIATAPLLRAMGLDAGKNDEDKGKAELAYGGMSKEDLITHIGEPMEKYHCDDKYGGHEVWTYSKGQVIRGGRALFIRLDDGEVYHTSHNTNFFKDSCSLLASKP